MERVVWEYLTLPEAERNRLAELGEEGWELVGIGGTAGEPHLYLKRRGADLRERVTLEQRDRYYAALSRSPQGELGERPP